MLDVKSVPKLLGRKALFVTLSALLIVAAMHFGARVAEADSIWHQSYQRGSASDVCVAQLGETPWEDSWGTNPGWSPSWEQWANSGQGGWVCSRSITWAQKPVSSISSGGGSSSVTYAVGDTGPGGGLVFLISGGLTYEMALKTWGVNETTGIAWCNDSSTSIAGALGTAVGTGSANTTAVLNFPCTSGAAVAVRGYAGGGFTDWFLPSQDELNAMWLCSQAGGFNTATYGFAGAIYWNSSQIDADAAWNQNLDNGDQIGGSKVEELRVRPIRAF